MAIKPTPTNSSAEPRRKKGTKGTPTDTHESLNRGTSEGEGKWRSNRHPRTAQPNHEGGKGQRATPTDTHEALIGSTKEKRDKEHRD